MAYVNFRSSAVFIQYVLVVALLMLLLLLRLLRPCVAVAVPPTAAAAHTNDPHRDASTAAGVVALGICVCDPAAHFPAQRVEV